MTQRDNNKLFDITIALGLFVEGIKLNHALEFRAVLAAVDEDLRKLLSRINYKTLDGLSKMELNRLILSLRKSQSRIYTAYTERLIKQLQDFMRIRLDVGAVAYGSAKWNFLKEPGETPFTSETFKQLSEAEAHAFIAMQSEKETFSPLYGLAAIGAGSVALWSTVKNAPIPANGLYLLPFISTFARSAQASVENTIRKAYANGQSVEETLAEISGKKTAAGNSTQFAKIQLQANAVIDTAFSHVDQISSQAIASAIFARYVWCSVIDGATTFVCRDRDGKSYRYGHGPIPPAHYRCRSVTIPLASLFGDFKGPTLYAWLKKQSRAIQVEFLGRDGAQSLNSGELTAKEFGQLQIGKPLKLTQLKQMLKLILST